MFYVWSLYKSHSLSHTGKGRFDGPMAFKRIEMSVMMRKKIIVSSKNVFSFLHTGCQMSLLPNFVINKANQRHPFYNECVRTNVFHVFDYCQNGLKNVQFLHETPCRKMHFTKNKHF